MKFTPKYRRGFTLIEALVLIAIIVIFLALIPHPPHSAKARAKRISCMNNLKIIGLASRLWANDHGGQFGFASPNTNSSLAWMNSPNVIHHYLAISNELDTPKVLTCPADKERIKASDFTQLSNSNLSYFVGLDARPDNPQSLLSGDRNITGGTLSNGFLRRFNANSDAGWTKEIHQNAGNIGLGDGSVQQVTPMRLRQQIALATTNSSFIRLAVP
jgi:hypothetical protein